MPRRGKRHEHQIRRVWTVPLTGAAAAVGVLPLAQRFVESGQWHNGILFFLACGAIGGVVAYFATPSFQRDFSKGVGR